MKPNKRLSEIEKAEKSVSNWQGYPFLRDDVKWLIDRVKLLTENLQIIAVESDSSISLSLHSDRLDQLRDTANKALNAETMQGREVVPIDWDKIWEAVPDVDPEYFDKIQQLVEKQLKGE